MHVIEIFALVAGAVLITALCRRQGWPAPLVLVAAGLVASFVPGVPRFEVDPELILDFVLPPLLFSAALATSYQDFRRSLNSITRLGVGLVLVSALAVAVAAWLLAPALPFAAALVLGAVVAPPDAVAAAAVGRRLGLPRRVMTLLTGESLINDATSLTLYKVALAGVATGVWSFSEGLQVFAVAVVAGVGVGLVLGWLLHQLRLRLDDPVVASAIGVLTPFAAYWGAEAIGGSGVLAVVAAGLLLASTSPRAGYATRLYQEPVWSTVDLLLEAFTFALIGIQLKWLIADVNASDQGLGQAALLAVVVLAVAMLVRPAYVLATAGMDRVRMRGSHRTADDALTRRESLVVSWAGMRGVVTLAAAAAIPTTLAGEAFPQRATLQLVAYAVAIGTLLLQGLTLPGVIRRLDVGSGSERRQDAIQEAQVRVATAEAAQQVIARRRPEIAAQLGDERADRVISTVVAALNARGRAAAELLDPDRAVEGASRWPGRRAQALRREVIAAQREVLVERRDSGELDEAVMQRVLRELDLEEGRMSASWVTRL
ncbi:Na+/H+ antiporter [Cellulomonas timonensis]|uniref:Na+/H+ antiporter n=1 Tax=Cellulomonas timonensis TaxID=1689271 RepID=UPI000AA62DDD|nr:Na+/H+ antiporter [Cellulomonas timonensis]